MGKGHPILPMHCWGHPCGPQVPWEPRGHQLQPPAVPHSSGVPAPPAPCLSPSSPSQSAVLGAPVPSTDPQGCSGQHWSPSPGMELGVPGWIWGWSWGSQDDPGWSRLAGCPPGPVGLSWLPPPHVLVLGSVPPRQGPACPLSASVRFCHPRSLGGPSSCGPSGPSQGLRVGCRVGCRVKGEKVTEAHLAPSWRARSGVTSVSPSPWSLWPIRPGCCPPRRPSSGLGKDQETPMFHEGHTTTQNHPHGFRAPGEEEEELCGH